MGGAKQDPLGQEASLDQQDLPARLVSKVLLVQEVNLDHVGNKDREASQVHSDQSGLPVLRAHAGNLDREASRDL